MLTYLFKRIFHQNFIQIAICNTFEVVKHTAENYTGVTSVTSNSYGPMSNSEKGSTSIKYVLLSSE